MALAIDQVVDNLDNSLTIIAHDDNGSYTTGMGRKSDMPDSENFSDNANMEYYQSIVQQYCLPAEPIVLYQAAGYTPPDDSENDSDSTPTDS